MLRAFLLIVLASCQLPACTCFDAPWKRQFSEAKFIFRGVAKSIERLPERPEMKRARYKVSFTVLESWKGSPKEPISVHYMAPGTDCLGEEFSERAEYLMFVVETPVRDYRLDEIFWHGWEDLLPKGTPMLIPNFLCNESRELQSAREKLRWLGKGKRTR